MEGSRYYRIAGHLFCVTADETWWDRMPNYVPFVEEHPSESVCFTLKCEDCSSVPSSEEYSMVYVDTSDSDMPRLEVSRSRSGDWLIAMAPWRDADTEAYLRLSEDFRCSTLYVIQPSKWAMDNAIMLQYAFVTSTLSTLEMHAAVIKKAGRAYVFLGKSGTGKSTHARQWLKAFADAELMNDDNPVLRVVNGEVRVYGSAWSGKTPCYKNDSAPVEAIYLLAQAPENVLRPLTMPEAYAAMLMSVSGMKVVKNCMDKIYETIVSVIQTVGVYHLDCLPNEDAARVAAGINGGAGRSAE